ncbi:MAG: hypothetical protein OIF57_11430 [Marinobacterium sp.]|nr:hypothetical protein [Marinobacterium sp.]
MSVFLMVQLLVVATALLLFMALRMLSHPPEHWYLLRQFRFSVPVQRLGRVLMVATAGFMLLCAQAIHPDAAPVVALIPGTVAALLALVALRLCYDSVRLYDHGIAGISLLGLRRHIGWEQIQAVTLNQTTEALCLQGAQARPVYLSVDLYWPHTLIGCLRQQLTCDSRALDQWHQVPETRRNFHEHQRRLIRYSPLVALAGLGLVAACLVQVLPPLLAAVQVIISGVLLGLPAAAQAATDGRQLRLLQSALAQLLCSSAAMMLIQNQMQADINSWQAALYVGLMVGCAGLLVVLARLRYGGARA